MIWSELRFRLRALFRRGAVDRELEDELRFHVEREIEKHLRAGMRPAEARRRALVEFGGVDRITEETRAVRGIALLDRLLQDVRYGWRGIRSRPGFAAAIVLTLGLGFGATAAMFDVVDRLLLRAPAFLRSPDRVHRVYVRYVSDGRDVTSRSFAYLGYADLRRFSGSFDALALFADRMQAVGRGDATRELPVAIVSASFFDFFDARPVAGRFFTTEEDTVPAGVKVAVLGHRYWQTAHGGSTEVLGREIRIGEAAYTIVGVAPPGFAGITAGPAPVAFVPATAFAYARMPEYAQDYGWEWLEVLVRRGPDVAVATASADLSAALAASWEQRRERSPSRSSAAEARVAGLLSSVHPARGPDAGPEAKVATWILGVTFVVLLIAAANVVNLLLVRALHRGREIALRLALGVSRARLLQQLLIETLLLTGMGAAAGLLAARVGGTALRALFMPAGEADAIAIDARSLLFVAVLTFAVALATGLAPATQALRSDFASTLRGGVRDTPRQGAGLRASLLLLQGALCVLLLVGAGLFVRSLLNVRGLRLGYDADALLVVDTEMRGVQLAAAERDALSDRLVEASAGLAGIRGATPIASVPFYSFEGRGAAFVPGRDSLNLLGRYTIQTGSHHYFETTGTRILRGRGFLPTDIAGAQPVVVIGRAMADAIWPGEDPLGRQIRFGGDHKPLLTIVGVAEDIRGDSFGGLSAFWYYVPLQQYRAIFEAARSTLLVRVEGDPTARAESVRARLQREMPGDAYVRVEPFEKLLERPQRSWRAGATMFVTFAALALVLAAIGLYSVLAYGVARRTRELGIRIALGAGIHDVVGMIVRQGMLFALFSIAIGGAAALVAARRAETLLFDVSPFDPLVYGIVAAVLLSVALIATLRPAARAARVDPNIALRAD